MMISNHSILNGLPREYLLSDTTAFLLRRAKHLELDLASGGNLEPKG